MAAKKESEKTKILRQFENDYKLKHVVLKVDYCDAEVSCPLSTLELFGHCFQITTVDAKKVKAIYDPNQELECEIVDTSGSYGDWSDYYSVILGVPMKITLTIGNKECNVDHENMAFGMSLENLDILKKHYHEMNLALKRQKEAEQFSKLMQSRTMASEAESLKALFEYELEGNFYLLEQYKEGKQFEKLMGRPNEKNLKTLIELAFELNLPVNQLQVDFREAGIFITGDQILSNAIQEAIKLKYGTRFKDMPHNRLSEKATKIVINRPQGWEYALLAQVVTDEIEYQKVLATPLLSTIMAESPPNIFKIDTGVSLGNYCAWITAKINELDDLSRHFSNLLATDNQDAFGLPGQPGNPEKIVQLGIRVGELYSDVLVFENVIRMHSCDTSEFLNENYPEFKSKLIYILNDFRGIITEPLTTLVQFYEEWGPEILRRIHDAVSRVQPGEPLYLDLKLKLSLNFNATSVTERASLLLTEINIEADRISSETELMPPLASESLNAGYLYLLMNPSMPGLIKIGKTTRTADQRVKELGAATGVPTPFALVFEVWVHDCHRAEKYVHDLLSDNRVAGNREFFNAASTQAIKIMIDAEVYVRDDD